MKSKPDETMCMKCLTKILKTTFKKIKIKPKGNSSALNNNPSNSTNGF